MAPPEVQESLLDRRILLGVTGSIAAYKAALLVRRFRKAGAEVQVLMTSDATRFISPLTLGTLSGREVLTDLFPDDASEHGQPGENAWTQHVTLGLWADVFVVAPATAQTIAKLAYGFSDSMLTATALSAECPLLVCPAMDRDMYQHLATQSNLERLRALGYTVLPAEHGELASGLVGQGRLPDPESIVEQVIQMLNERDDAEPEGFPADFDPAAARSMPAPEDDGRSQNAAPSPAPSPPPERDPGAASSRRNFFAGMRVLVTAGPTQEPIDPVRVITNRSTGTMGYALAQAAAARGAAVTLVSGPTCLETPPDVERIDVMTTKEMNTAVQQHADADLVIMAAAVSDYTPARTALSKIKKDDSDELVLRFRRTPDILKTLGEHKRPYQQLVGFALETDDGLANARRKLEAKNLDWIALNNPLEEGAGFGTTTNRITLLHRDGYKESLPLLRKSDLAEALLDRVAAVGVGTGNSSDGAPSQ